MYGSSNFVDSNHVESVLARALKKQPKVANGGSTAALPPGSVDDFAAAAECLKTLAHPVRLRAVQMLLHGRFTVGELAADSQIADNAMSDHLRLLQRCGFLDSERDGRRVYYRVAEPHLKQLMKCVEARFLP